VPAAKNVIVSVGDESIYRPAVLKANADDFVSKSKLSADLLSAIRRAIGRQ
jgi:DNA-binding NarL/FixJ family response regulator